MTKLLIILRLCLQSQVLFLGGRQLYSRSGAIAEASAIVALGLLIKVWWLLSVAVCGHFNGYWTAVNIVVELFHGKLCRQKFLFYLRILHLRLLHLFQHSTCTGYWLAVLQQCSPQADAGCVNLATVLLGSKKHRTGVSLTAFLMCLKAMLSCLLHTLQLLRRSLNGALRLTARARIYPDN